MRICFHTKWLVSLLFLYSFISSISCAEDVTGLQQELADLKAAVYSLEAAQLAPATSGDSEALTSMNRNARVLIGGEVAVDYAYLTRTKQGSSGNRLQSSEWKTQSANLRFRIDATPDAYFYLKLDLDDAGSNTPGQGLIEECKFIWQNIRSSDWGLVFGKGEVPYGQDRTLGIIQSYHHNDLLDSGEGPTILTGSKSNPDPLVVADDPSLGRTAHPGEVDNVYLLELNYTFRDFLKFEASVFQNNDGRDENGYLSTMHENRSDDFGMQSFAFRTWFTPLEGLTVESSFIRKHSATRGDTDVFGQAAKTSQMAASFGFDYVSAGPWEFFGEYQHGWDWNYTEGYDVDIAQLAAVREITPSFKLGVMTEWMRIDDRGEIDNYAKLVTSGKYMFDTGIYLILEYGYEWFDFGDADAHMIAFRCGWNF